EQASEGGAQGPAAPEAHRFVLPDLLPPGDDAGGESGRGHPINGRHRREDFAARAGGAVPGSGLRGRFHEERPDSRRLRVSLSLRRARMAVTFTLLAPQPVSAVTSCTDFCSMSISRSTVCSV